MMNVIKMTPEELSEREAKRNIVVKALEQVQHFIEMQFSLGTKIEGLEFEMKVEEGRLEDYYYLVAIVPQEQLGLLTNNFKVVCIVIQVYPWMDEGRFTFRASWRYSHHSGGSNGTDVMFSNPEQGYWRGEVRLA